MREVQVVKSLNIELARVFPGDEMTMEFRNAKHLSTVLDEYIVMDAEIKTRIVPIHTICKVVGHKDGPMGKNSEPIVDTKYIAYSPEVEDFFGQPFRCFQEQLLAQAKQIKHLTSNEAYYRTQYGREQRKRIDATNWRFAVQNSAGFFRRLIWLFTGVK